MLHGVELHEDGEDVWLVFPLRVDAGDDGAPVGVNPIGFKSPDIDAAPLWQPEEEPLGAAPGWPSIMVLCDDARHACLRFQEAALGAIYAFERSELEAFRLRAIMALHVPVPVCLSAQPHKTRAAQPTPAQVVRQLSRQTRGVAGARHDPRPLHSLS